MQALTTGSLPSSVQISPLQPPITQPSAADAAGREEEYELAHTKPSDDEDEYAPSLVPSPVLQDASAITERTRAGIRRENFFCCMSEAGKHDVGRTAESVMTGLTLRRGKKIVLQKFGTRQKMSCMTRFGSGNSRRSRGLRPSAVPTSPKWCRHSSGILPEYLYLTYSRCREP